MSDIARINRAIKLVAQLSVDRASQVFSKLIRGGATIEMESAYVVDISVITEKVSRENEEIAGVFVDLEGLATFKFFFFVKLANSFILADMMMRKDVGTTKEFDVYASSAVQEIGNILASAFANVFSSDFQITMRPSPPVVVHDFSGAVFEEFLMSAALERDEVLIIQSRFKIAKGDVSCHMFILPIKNSEKVLGHIAGDM